MTIGFTGTRKGMTQCQILQFRRFMDDFSHFGQEFHHGGAIGADTEAATRADRQHGCKVVHHPPDRAGARALLNRNRAIVAASEILIAAPETDEEQLRSGTWATIRYARAKGIPIVMLSRGK